MLEMLNFSEWMLAIIRSHLEELRTPSGVSEN